MIMQEIHASYLYINTNLIGMKRKGVAMQTGNELQYIKCRMNR